MNGDISTDFPLTVTGKIARRKLEGTVGSGGRLLEMKTVNGGIELQESGFVVHQAIGIPRPAHRPEWHVDVASRAFTEVPSCPFD